MPEDLYTPETFDESIVEACQRALHRLTEFRSGVYDNMQAGDVLLGHVDRVDRDATYTSDTLFAASFDNINQILLDEDVPAQYLKDIVANMLACGLDKWAQSIGNKLVQLQPDSETLSKHVEQVWRECEVERHLRQPFAVYRVSISNDIVEIVLMPDDTSKGWSIGYKTILRYVRINYERLSA